MRTVRFRDDAGYIRTGEWVGEGTLTAHGNHYDLDSVDVLPPTQPSKIICVASNYLKHIEEGGGEVPDRPSLFMKGPNAVAGHGDTITLPTPAIAPEDIDKDDAGEIDIGSGRIDHEAELGVVIGSQCRHVTASDAMDVVRGFTCFNDISNRDDQRIESNWIRGKAFDGAAPFGPVIASPDLVPSDPRIRLWVNGEKRQDSRDDEFVFSVNEIIEAITAFVTLEPGDIIAMGTTSGVAPLTDGDSVAITIEGIGTLEHSVRRATPSIDA